jgi:hypothetical protein
LFLTACATERSPNDWLESSVGRRDAALFDAYEMLFGSHVRCIASCVNCGEALEARFDVADVRVQHDETGATHPFELGELTLTFRSASSADLLRVGGLSPAEAERLLLESCVLEARTPDGAIAVSALPEHTLRALSQHMATVDAQAEVLFALACPECGLVQEHPFDIATHLWAQLDRWARTLLGDVHVLARAYHWSERSILNMTWGRRSAYLTLLGAT